MKSSYFFLQLLFILLQLKLSYAQFEVKSFETTHIDSTLEAAKPGLFYYKKYPEIFFDNKDFSFNKKYNFTVYLKDGKTVNVKSAIFLSEDKHFLTNGNEKIYPENTKQIVAHFEEYDYYGIPNDSNWLFRNNEDNDAIYTYSFLPKSKKRFIVYVKPRKSNLPFIAITKENILSLVKNDNTAKEFALKNKLISAIKAYNYKN